ncbi:peptidase domain-containing ABC transporter [Saccharospirillum salsuginis]|uniref:ABC transporter n=1 Tax=Saccharospirillum salsuginis TaxID=418750 RepID=A0A918KD93_9GAMM|nr:peptidase domain-containing ABC transporter [Saccharospirillum salsuginis]GGX57830.1 ABC transporter [Saccharospirillum salsuginis]
MSNPEKGIFNGLHFRFSRRLPVYHQTESAECGIACLAMVATYYGYKTSVDRLRQRFPASQRGTNLKSLIGIGQSVGLSARPLKVGLHALGKVQTPAILHWGFDHFVVLKSVGRKGAVIHDPGQGERQLTLDELSDGYTGVAVELTPNADFERLDEREPIGIRSLWQHAGGLVPALGKILLLSLLIQAFALVTPYFIQLAIDEVVTSFDKDLLLVLGIAFITLHLFRALTFAFRSWVVAYVGAQLNFQLSSNLFTHLMRLPGSFFVKRHVGDIVSRFTSLDEINKLLTTGFVEAIVDGIVVITVLVVMAYYSWTLTLIAVGVVALYAVIRIALLGPIRRSMEERIVNAAKEDSHFLESARAIETIRSFNHEPVRVAGWQNRYADQVNSDVKLERLRIAYRSVSLFITGTEHVVLIWLGALMIMDQSLTVGMLYAFLNYRQQFSDQSLAFIDKMIEFRILRLHLNRVADIVTATPETGRDSERGKFEPISGAMEIKNLCFRYHPQEEDVVHNLSFSVSAGESLAITGPSGCGKTTLFKMLTGLLQPTDGQILIDGVNLKDFGVRNYRDDIAVVLQSDQLFSGTILDNITLFDDKPDMEWAVQCAAAAAIAEEVMKLPMGFQTLVGDLGSSLSGGQKQRILLARAIYRKPRILFLDEATSHLDQANEQRINEMIRQLGITRVAIAHRRETLETADRVLTLSNSVGSKPPQRPQEPAAAAV